jgi:hypothetical protein
MTLCYQALVFSTHAAAVDTLLADAAGELGSVGECLLSLYMCMHHVGVMCAISLRHDA